MHEPSRTRASVAALQPAHLPGAELQDRRRLRLRQLPRTHLLQHAQPPNLALAHSEFHPRLARS